MNKTEIMNKLNISSFYQSLIPSLKLNGKSDVLGLCPFHDDHNASLSVNVETGFYRCFTCDAKGDVFTFYQELKKVDFPTAIREIGEFTGITNTDVKPKVVARFEYRDVNGQVLYTKERIEPGRNGRSKEFIFKHLEGGQWVLGRGADPVLYRLPELVKSKYAFIVEGEGKADLLASWGLTATCLDSGASSPIRDEYIEILAKMEKVAILPDNDTPGKQYADKLANALHAKVKEIKIVELPGLGDAEDILDWAKVAGNNKEKLIELVKNTPVWIPTKEEVQKESMAFTKLSDLFQEPEEQTKWLVDRLLPTGGFSIVVAKPKVGKSTLARGLALNIATGESFLGKEVSKGAVIYLALEEKRSEVKKHFQDLGASGTEEIHIYVGGAPVDAINQIKTVVEKLKPALLIIDPLFRFTRVKDGNDYHQVTNALEPLLRLARDTGTHVLCVHHSRKGEGAAEDSFLGSQAIFGSVDTSMIMKRHEHYRTLQTIQRYGDDLPETILSYDKDTRSTSLGGSKQDEDANIMGNAIIEFLSTQSEPVTEQTIINEVEGNGGLKRKAIRELVRKGKINRDGQGTKGKPFLYSRILVPTIYPVREYENPKMTANPHGSKDYSRTGDFPLFQKDEGLPVRESEHQEQEKIAANSTSKDEVKTQNLDEELITLDEFEIVENV